MIFSMSPYSNTLDTFCNSLNQTFCLAFKILWNFVLLSPVKFYCMFVLSMSARNVPCLFQTLSFDQLPNYLRIILNFSFTTMAHYLSIWPPDSLHSPCRCLVSESTYLFPGLLVVNSQLILNWAFCKTIKVMLFLCSVNILQFLPIDLKIVKNS